MDRFGGEYVVLVLIFRWSVLRHQVEMPHGWSDGPPVTQTHGGYSNKSIKYKEAIEKLRELFPPSLLTQCPPDITYSSCMALSLKMAPAVASSLL